MFYGKIGKQFTRLLVKPSKHTTLLQRHYNVAATSRRCSDVVRMLLRRCLFAEKKTVLSRVIAKKYTCNAKRPRSRTKQTVLLLYTTNVVCLC